jgi:hypothetical protein
MELHGKLTVSIDSKKPSVYKEFDKWLDLLLEHRQISSLTSNG